MKYPIKKVINLGKQSTVSNRGMDLEEAINLTNQVYIDRDRAYIYKKPIPIQVVSVMYEKRSAAKITEAYYKIPSTTDYNGIYRGRYLDFEAKETISKTSFPLKNIHEHQVKHLEHITNHGGIGFIIVQFKSLGKVFLLDSRHVSRFYQRYLEHSGERRSISLTEFEEFGHIIKESYALRLDYLSIVDQVYFESS